MSTPHLLQVFLGEHGVDEVTVTPRDHLLSCTCRYFIVRQDCQHLDYIESRMVNGDYRVEIPDGAVELMKDELTRNPQAWREFVLKYAPVVVLS